MRGAWRVLGTGGLPGGGKNLLPPFAGDLPQGLALQPFLEIVGVHGIIFHQSPITICQII
jgi:hypothetical protein